MDMYQKREIRKNKKIDQNEKSSSTNINWFPGHMTKAKREMQEKLKMVDMVVECRDARIPNASKNPMLDELIQHKPRCIILTKTDKADPVETDKWIKKLSNDTTKVIGCNILKDNMTSILTQTSKEIMASFIERQKRRGINPRAIRIMIVGIPNVGKSTLINRVAKKKAVVAADRPGVTRSLTWVKINKDLELLDTPGVLWPKFDDQKIGLCLGISGSIKDEILSLEDVCLFGLDYCMHYYPEQLKQRYDIEIDENAVETLRNIARARKCIKANNQLDEEKAIQLFIKEARDGLIGRITWEKCDANE
ncbi:MAG: ribosome biogenesis GTPase YlqF [Traorella sp.]